MSPSAVEADAVAAREKIAAYVESRVAEILALRQEDSWLDDEVSILARILASEIRSGAAS